MNTFSQIVNGVGVRIGDTSSTFATEIKRYINFRYKDIWSRFNWGVIDEDYTFNTTGVDDYLLPADFGKPLYCYDNTNGVNLIETDLQEIVRFYAGDLDDSAASTLYAIYEKTNSSTGVIEKWIRLYPAPSSIIAILMPYTVNPTDMSGNADLPIMDVSYEIELGATADAWRTKRQFAKAADFEGQYERLIMQKIWNKENSSNKVFQFVPMTYNKDNLY
jgi:hypothetical protein